MDVPIERRKTVLYRFGLECRALGRIERRLHEYIERYPRLRRELGEVASAEANERIRLKRLRAQLRGQLARSLRITSDGHCVTFWNERALEQVDFTPLRGPKAVLDHFTPEDPQ